MPDPDDRPEPDRETSVTAEDPPGTGESTLERWRLFVDRRTPEVSRRAVLRAGGATAGLGVAFDVVQ